MHIFQFLANYVFTLFSAFCLFGACPLLVFIVLFLCCICFFVCSSSSSSLDPSYFLHPTELSSPSPLFSDSESHKCSDRDFLQQTSGDQIEKRPDKLCGTSLAAFWNYMFAWFICRHWSASCAADADAFGCASQLTLGCKAINHTTHFSWPWFSRSSASCGVGLQLKTTQMVWSRFWFFSCFAALGFQPIPEVVWVNAGGTHRQRNDDQQREDGSSNAHGRMNWLSWESEDLYLMSSEHWEAPPYNNRHCHLRLKYQRPLSWINHNLKYRIIHIGQTSIKIDIWSFKSSAIFQSHLLLAPNKTYRKDFIQSFPQSIVQGDFFNWFRP